LAAWDREPVLAIYFLCEVALRIEIKRKLNVAEEIFFLIGNTVNSIRRVIEGHQYTVLILVTGRYCRDGRKR